MKQRSPRRLRQWLSDLAYDELGAQLNRSSRELGLSFSRIQIRRQRTRWGSCSATGTISLNVCLMFLEPAVVRYLYVHELCHTRHMNHSPQILGAGGAPRAGLPQPRSRAAQGLAVGAGLDVRVAADCRYTETGG